MGCGECSNRERTLTFFGVGSVEKNQKIKKNWKSEEATSTGRGAIAYLWRIRCDSLLVFHLYVGTVGVEKIKQQMQQTEHAVVRKRVAVQKGGTFTTIFES
jgi:hypothetical protein